MSLLKIDFENQAMQCFDFYASWIDPTRSNYTETVKSISKLGCAKKYSEKDLRTLIAIIATGTIPNKDRVLESKIQGSLAEKQEKAKKHFAKFIPDAYQMYLISHATRLQTKILGPASLREDHSVLSGFGVLASSRDPSHDDLDQELAIHGCILNDGKWNLLKNDAAMLAAIHAHQTIYIAATDPDSLQDEDLYNTKEGYTRVLGREIAQLCLAGGYKMVIQKHANMGITLVCTDHAKANGCTLPDMSRAVETVKTATKVKEILKSGTVSYADVLLPCPV